MDPTTVKACVKLPRLHDNLGRFRTQDRVPSMETTEESIAKLLHCMTCMESGAYKEAMEGLLHCHQTSIKTGDQTAFDWSIDYLVQCIDGLHSQSMNPNALYNMIAGFLKLEAENEAWAAYYIGKWASFKDMEMDAVKWLQKALSGAKGAWAAYYIGKWASFKVMEMDAVEWLQKALSGAKCSLLSYYASWELGKILLELSWDSSRVIQCFQTMHGAAIQFQKIEPLVYSISALCNAFCTYKRFSEARQVREMMEGVQGGDILVRIAASKLEGHICFLVRQFYESRAANQEVVKLVESAALMDLRQHYKNYLTSNGNMESPWSPYKILWTLELLGMAWFEIGSSNLELGNISGALEAFAEVDSLGTRHQLGLSSLGTCFTEGNLLFLLQSCLGQNKLEEAEEYAIKLLQLPESTAGPIICIQLVLAKIAYAYHKQQLHQGILDVVESLLSEAEILTMSSPNASNIVSGLQGFYYLENLKFDLAIEKLEKHLRKAMSLEDNFGSFHTGRISYFDSTKERFRDLQMALLQLQPPNVKQAVVWAERERARDLMYGIKMRSHASLGDMFDKNEEKASLADMFDENEEKAWQEIESSCNFAGDDTVFLMYTFYRDCLLINYFLHASEDPRFFFSHYGTVEAGKQLPIFSLVPKVIMSIKNESSQCQQYLEMFYMLLISPWIRELERIKPKHIVVIPAEELSILPFAALRNPFEAGSPFLIQRYVLTCIPSLRLFKNCRSQIKLGQYPKNALVVGNPSLRTKGYRNLRHAEKEAQGVCNFLRKAHFTVVDLLQRDLATKEKVLSLLPSYDWVHIASHAIVNSHYPNGGLLLGSSEVDGKVPTDTEYHTKERRLDKFEWALESFAHHADFIRNGEVECSDETERSILKFIELAKSNEILTGDEIEAQVRLNAMVVVLSACSTGLGQICAEGIVGLSRSLHMLGVSTVVVSLWDVSDRVTKTMMERFYNNLANGMELAIAMQQGMKAMIEAEDDCSNSIYTVKDWAPFIISGNPIIRIT